MLGKRREYNDVSGLPYRPHNVTHIALSTVFLWVGWFGFNGGSALLWLASSPIPLLLSVELLGFSSITVSRRSDPQSASAPALSLVSSLLPRHPDFFRMVGSHLRRHGRNLCRLIGFKSTTASGRWEGTECIFTALQGFARVVFGWNGWCS